jgi:tetratricopeptide (TPR) repeat protein
MHPIHTSLQNQRRALFIPSAQGTPAPDYVDALIDLANMASMLDYGQAVGILKEARAYAELFHYDKGLVIVLTQLAWVLFQQGKVDEALIQATRARFVADQHGLEPMRLSAIHMIALIHQRAGRKDEAARLWRTISEQAATINDQSRLADSQASLGILFAEQMRHSDALPRLRDALHVFDALNDDNAILVMNALTLSLLALGQTAEARAIVNQALARCPVTMPEWRSALLHTLGKVQLAEGLVDIARRSYTQALNLAREFNCDVDSECPPLLDLGHVAMTQKDLPRAIELFEAGLARASDAQRNELTVQFHHALHDAFVAIGAFAEATHHIVHRGAVTAKIEDNGGRQRAAIARAEVELQLVAAQWMQDSYAG